MRDINFVITDLDDTIWDWLSMWYESFYPYLKRISTEAHIDINLLKSDFKKLHQKYGTTEMSFVYEELTCINKRFYNLFEESSNSNKSILHEYYSNKKNNLHTYAGVIETLKSIKQKKTVIVAFTESNVFFTKYRIKHLGLDKIIDCIYSPEGPDIPSSVHRHYPSDHWDPKTTIIKVLPKETKKPNPNVLKAIIADYKANIDQTIYIGDKLNRDIYMAQQAKITNVYASYGHIINDERYRLLTEVTHWSKEDVEREIQFKSRNLKILPPDYTIQSFPQIENLFNFKEFKNEKNGANNNGLGKNN